ncbi:MAG: energy-coupling factor transporter transmembrane component T [Oscillospiraceae bacterium]
MKTILMQSENNGWALRLDPRTKLLLLLTMAFFVVGGAAGERLYYIRIVLCVFPFLLLMLSRRLRAAMLYAGVYSVVLVLFRFYGPHAHGILNFLILAASGIITCFLPSMMMGAYVVSTTTVSEFTAAMRRMHISEKLIIPMSAMFRFFPTVADEFSSINAAMKMRGISFGGKNAAKMLEYRLVPLMICSAKIGEELSAAALTRGLGTTAKRTNICEIGFKAQDYIVIILCIMPIVLTVLERTGAI